MDRFNREIEFKGSNGGFDKASKTLGRFQAGVKGLEIGRFKKKALSNAESWWGAVETDPP